MGKWRVCFLPIALIVGTMFVGCSQAEPAASGGYESFTAFKADLEHRLDLILSAPIAQNEQAEETFVQLGYVACDVSQAGGGYPTFEAMFYKRTGTTGHEPVGPESTMSDVSSAVWVAATISLCHTDPSPQGSGTSLLETWHIVALVLAALPFVALVWLVRIPARRRRRRALQGPPATAGGAVRVEPPTRP